MTQRKGNKSKPPSRKKYENENPTVSARVPVKTRDALRISLAKLGMTLPDALKVLAGELAVKVIPINEARKAGHEEAKNHYIVTYPCSVCGKLIPLTSQKAKEAVSRYMTSQG